MSSMFEDVEELRELLKQVKTWGEQHRKDGNTEQADWLQLYLDALYKIDDHQRAQAAVWAIKAMYHAMIEDADRGLNVRHVKKPLYKKAPVHEVVALWHQLHESEPDIKRVDAVQAIADDLGCSVRTVENRLKEGGITANKK